MIPQIFNYEETENMRTATDDLGEPWFCAKDVCEILGIKNYRDAITALDKGNTFQFSTDTLGGKQKVNYINEFGLYEIILNSRKPRAKKFKRWIFSEVLPSIRKTGQYSVKPMSEIEVAERYLNSLKENEKLKKEQIQLTGEVKKLKPKADYADSALLPGINVSINVFAKTNGFKPNVLTKWFRDEKILMTGKHKNDKKHLVPYQEWTKYFECIQETYEKANGEKDYRIKPLIMHDKQPLLLKYINKNAPGLVFKNKPKELTK